MELNEKLQILRRRRGLTQEQLAEALFVSRTAVSKWESGRGCPSIESLKAISRLFSISIDELLSGDELLDLARRENRSRMNGLCGTIWGLLDLSALILIFLPLWGRQEGASIRSVPLLSGPDLSPPLLAASLFLLIALAAFGLAELLSLRLGAERPARRFRLCSAGLHTAAVLVFALSRQPYGTALLFLLLAAKAALLVHLSKQAKS